MATATTVEGTNDFSIVSKLSAASAGYFKDNFLVEFVEKQRRRASLINWGYYLRYKSLEATFEKIVQCLCDRTGDFQILSVGAGFDTTYFTVGQYGKNYKFYEVDLPSNVQRKSSLIKKSEKCCKMLKNPKFSSEGIFSDNFILFACDLANQKEFKQKLQNLGFDFAINTVILSECVITYMDEVDSTNLIKFLSSNLKHSAFFVYEQIKPYDGFGQFMVSHFQKIGSPIKGVTRYPTTSAQCTRYLDCGWERCYTITLTEVYISLSTEEKQRIFGIEPFDEFEEFMLKSSHYLVVCSANGVCCSLLDSLLGPSRVDSPVATVPDFAVEAVSGANISRFGHRVGVFQDTVYVIGGFGVDKSTHKRLDEMLLINMSGPVPTLNSLKNPVFARMYPGMAMDKEIGRLIVSGGRLAPTIGLEDILSIDCQNAEWSLMGVRLPGGRWRHSTAVLGQYLIVIGGCGIEGARKDVLAVDMNTGEWLEPVVLTDSVHSGSGVVWGDKILYSGGWGSNGVIGSMRTIGIKKRKLIVRELNIQVTPRFSHTSHVVRDHLIVVGGVGLKDDPPLEIFNLITGEVVKARLPSSVDEELLMVHNHGSAVIGEHILLIGGGGNCFSFGTHYNKIYRLNLRQLLS